MCGADQVHIEHGISGQLAPYQLRRARKAPSWGLLYTQKLPAKTVLQVLITFNEIKGQKKEGK